VVPGWWALAAVALGVSLIIMDGTVVNVALPVVIGDLHGRRRLFLVVGIVLGIAGGTIFMGNTTSDRASFLMAAGCTIALGADALGLYPTSAVEANVSAARAQAL
jgi:hypothetical protein